MNAEGKNGKHRPIDESAAPIKDAEDRVLGVVMVFRDVTERRRLERSQRDLNRELERQVQERTTELQASEERFRFGDAALGIGCDDRVAPISHKCQDPCPFLDIARAGRNPA